jgi:hypothetical protein
MANLRGHGQGHFAAHIAGFDALNGKTSSFFRDGESYTSVSAPASLLLSILGLGTLPFLRRLGTLPFLRRA